MTTILAIDPGNTESGWCLVDSFTRKPHHFGKDPNTEVLQLIATTSASDLVIEMVASYGMPVGAEVFETCVWIGRFLEASESNAWVFRRRRETRQPIKMHHCHDSRAKDSNVTQALVDRFAPGQPNRGKGTKAEPGWFHGFHSDIWQAYALAVYTADEIEGRP